jgi:hypothetical protein
MYDLNLYLVGTVILCPKEGGDYSLLISSSITLYVQLIQSIHSIQS